MKEYIKVDKSKGRVNGFLNMMFFNDHGSIIAYLPSLNISGYGESEKEATDMITTTVTEYFRSLLPQPFSVITNELMKCGWIKKKYFKKQYEPTAFVDPDGVLKDFNLPKDAFLKEKLVAVGNG